MNNKLITSLIVSALMSSPVFAFPSLGGDTDLSSMVSSSLEQVESNSALLSQVTSQLPVSETQAAGGLGSLLSLAQNQLSDENNSELESLLPGLDQLNSLTGSGNSDLLSSVTDMDSVNSVFNKLGLDSSMVSQFTPLILQYLSSEGASNGLISSLTSIWQ